MKNWLCVLAGLTVLTLTSSCEKPQTDDAAFGRRVHAYLLAHPEVLLEAEEKLQAKAAELAATGLASVMRQAQARLPSVRAALEHDAGDFVANPGGRITVTEAYDYRCPHCVNAAPSVLKLIRANPDIRFVFKEMPIFGEPSGHAARAALAVKRAGGDSLGYYQTLMASRVIDDELIDREAFARGARAADLKLPPAADIKHLADTATLFDSMKLDATPVFIIGDTVIPGERLDQVKAAIAKARAQLVLVGTPRL